MAVDSTRKIALTFAEDLTYNQTFSAATNPDSPGVTTLITLASGANTITPPTGGSDPKAVTIIPPAANVETITLKGVTGDTGVVIHKTDPTSIGLNSPTATFVLTASAQIEGVRLVWS